jgi:mutual gliding-motility protein MglA
LGVVILQKKMNRIFNLLAAGEHWQLTPIHVYATSNPQTATGANDSMPLILPTKKQVNAKVVYYGANEAGKITNLRQLYQRLAAKDKGEFRTMPLFSDQAASLFFFPMDVGKVQDYQLRMHLYTVQGDLDNHESAHRLVLTGTDGVVFVADSQEQAMEHNLEQLQLLQMSLAEPGKEYPEVPIVFQYNKRDLTGVLSVEELNRYLNPTGLPYLEASAARGAGVVETLAWISKLMFQEVKRFLETQAAGWDEDPVTRFIRSREDMQVEMIGDLQDRREDPAVKIRNEKTAKYRDIFGRSWL